MDRDDVINRPFDENDIDDFLAGARGHLELEQSDYMTNFLFAQEVARIHAAISQIDPSGPGIEVDEATQTVTLANGAIRAVGLEMVRFLADRLDSVSLHVATAQYGHSGQ